MKVSIALASYNGASYIREQLNSFSAQTRLPNEVVVCDDSSTDESAAIIEEFARTAPFPVVLVKNVENLGFTHNFEKTISLCSGEIVFFADQDDVWFSEKIQTVCNFFVEHPGCLMVIHDGWLVNEELEWFGATKRGQVMSGWGSDDLFATGALTVLRRQLLPYVLPLPAKIRGHDVWIHSLGRLLDSRLVMGTSLQMIRRHSSNTSAWIASSVSKINKRTIMIEGVRSTAATSYDDRILLNQALALRIESIKSQQPVLFAQSTLENALVGIRDEERAIRARNELLRLGSVRRRLAAVAMLVRGQYKHFNGFESFARDVLR